MKTQRRGKPFTSAHQKDLDMYCAVLSRIDFSGFFVAFPAQVLAAPVAEGHEFTFHSYVTSGADIIPISVRENHHFRNRHLQAVVGKDRQKVPEKCRMENGFVMHKFHGCLCPPVIDFLGWTA